MITDLFSHKIHSSQPVWAEKLVELASIFAEFDGLPFDRNAIEARLAEFSPRASSAARDRSRFRDEFSAYPAYLGLFRLEYSDEWIFRLSETAKRYLLGDQPNVAAFMMLQLSLFQYPNGMGVSYHSNSNGLRIQANTWERTRGFIRGGIHLSPVRLICKGIVADSTIRGIAPIRGRITKSEAFILANDERTNRDASPNIGRVIEVLVEARAGELRPPEHFENRFHILNHTDFIVAKGSTLSIRGAVDRQDAEDLLRKLNTVANLTIQFEGFDAIDTQGEFENAIRDGAWGRYFDGLTSLSGEAIESLAHDVIDFAEVGRPDVFDLESLNPVNQPLTYPLRPRPTEIVSPQRISRAVQLADPEATRIRRQRSNLSHKVIMEKLDSFLRNLGAEPYENEHIDVFARIPNDGCFIFEVKSATPTNLLSQTRKGISQLYEYRFRYQAEIGPHVKLCLVYPYEPASIDWLEDYLCSDREIAVCWFSNDGDINYSASCEEMLRPLLNN